MSTAPRLIKLKAGLADYAATLRFATLRMTSTCLAARVHFILPPDDREKRVRLSAVKLLGASKSPTP